MKKNLLLLALALGFLTNTACQKKRENKQETTKTETKAEATKEAKTETKENSNASEKQEQKPELDYAKLIQGRWENSEDNNFWNFYDDKKVYGDGNEQGTGYRIKGNLILYQSGSKARIISLTDKKMVLDLPDNGIKQTWIKADLEEKPKPEPAKSNVMNINPKMLLGAWDMIGGDDFSSLRFKANGFVDFIPYNDIYRYKVQGNTIVYSQAPNTPSPDQIPAPAKVLSLTAKELVFEGENGQKVRYKRSK